MAALARGKRFRLLVVQLDFFFFFFFKVAICALVKKKKNKQTKNQSARFIYA